MSPLLSYSVWLKVSEFYWCQRISFGFQQFSSLLFYFLFHWYVCWFLFIISFLLLTLALTSSFFSFLKCELMSWIWSFSSLKHRHFSAINFPLSTALAASYKFWYVPILTQLKRFYFPFDFFFNSRVIKKCLCYFQIYENSIVAICYLSLS